MNSKGLLHFQKEIIFLVIIAIVGYIVLMPVFAFLSLKYKLFLSGGMFMLAQYFRVILFERKIIWMRPFALKILFALINIPLFFLMLTWMMNYNSQLVDYGYNVEEVFTKDITAGMSVAKYGFLKSLTYFVGVGTMIIIVLFQFRMVYSLFKYREVPKILKG